MMNAHEKISKKAKEYIDKEDWADGNSIIEIKVIVPITIDEFESLVWAAVDLWKEWKHKDNVDLKNVAKIFFDEFTNWIYANVEETEYPLLFVLKKYDGTEEKMDEADFRSEFIEAVLTARYND